MEPHTQRPHGGVRPSQQQRLLPPTAAVNEDGGGRRALTGKWRELDHPPSSPLPARAGAAGRRTVALGCSGARLRGEGLGGRRRQRARGLGGRLPVEGRRHRCWRCPAPW